MALVTVGKHKGQWCDIILWDECSLTVEIASNKPIKLITTCNISDVRLSLDEALDLKTSHNNLHYLKTYTFIQNFRGYKIQKIDE